ncbi:Glutathione-regulated potassium-efflux system ATP-binding protein [Escherichia coli ISC7]|uniref:Glutathione-regulated potassium-efflux system ATP-binding protein n=1 Tax=Escherichia coli ISC7 TaxID=1432555 RepID=W1F167_ECOLX|nr:Glutathione-regulated potassium-efflux system ATP-binding protein [Escherichia coli ISC7]
MIVFSSLQIRRGVRVLLDNATATINLGRKSAWWVKTAVVNLPCWHC